MSGSVVIEDIAAPIEHLREFVTKRADNSERKNHVEFEARLAVSF